MSQQFMVINYKWRHDVLHLPLTSIHEIIATYVFRDMSWRNKDCIKNLVMWSGVGGGDFALLARMGEGLPTGVLLMFLF